jgi:hypothetical protein
LPGIYHQPICGWSVIWIRLNQAVPIDYWEERIYTDELLQRLQPLP